MVVENASYDPATALALEVQIPLPEWFPRARTSFRCVRRTYRHLTAIAYPFAEHIDYVAKATSAAFYG